MVLQYSFHPTMELCCALPIIIGSLGDILTMELPFGHHSRHYYTHTCHCRRDDNYEHGDRPSRNTAYPPPPQQPFDQPPPCSSVHHTSHERKAEPASYFSNEATVKIYCKAEPNYALTISRDKNVKLITDGKYTSKLPITNIRFLVINIACCGMLSFPFVVVSVGTEIWRAREMWRDYT
ncbi:hypothetical protein CDL15_Pgr001359 [Punica granatum]|uniref:Uncharacterized protein n=1 Tax=Punica granatum TaxID=22663 RepID=A0A218WKB7_PUNGR|nr:hypothetical protein CDL15_Pgr001359 [Punica granatum]